MMHSYYIFVCVASPDDGDLLLKHAGGLKFIYNTQFKHVPIVAH